MLYDVVIIGSGPAGVSAAIFCARANLKTLVLGKTETSQLVLAHTIENFFGFPEGIKGHDLLEKGIKQAKKFKAEFVAETVVSAKQAKEVFEVTTEKNKKIASRALIIATGIPIRPSGIENEEKFVGHGLSYCVSCDGFFYKGKKVCVIGNGNKAADEAIELLHYSGNVTIVSNGGGFEFSKEFDTELNKRGIKLVDKEAKEFFGENFLRGITFSDGTKMDFEGVFMACGESSALDFARELGVIVENNSVVIDERNMTNLSGVFAAGNCVGRCKQVAANVGEGANAAVNAIKYCGSKNLYMDYATK